MGSPLPPPCAGAPRRALEREAQPRVRSQGRLLVPLRASKSETCLAQVRELIRENEKLQFENSRLIKALPFLAKACCDLSFNGEASRVNAHAPGAIYEVEKAKSITTDPPPLVSFVCRFRSHPHAGSDQVRGGAGKSPG